MACIKNQNKTTPSEGIVVPGLSTAKEAEHDLVNLCLIEATSGSGIACRPLLTWQWCQIAVSLAPSSLDWLRLPSWLHFSSNHQPLLSADSLNLYDTRGLPSLLSCPNIASVAMTAASGIYVPTTLNHIAKTTFQKQTMRRESSVLHSCLERHDPCHRRYLFRGDGSWILCCIRHPPRVDTKWSHHPLDGRQWLCCKIWHRKGDLEAAWLPPRQLWTAHLQWFLLQGLSPGIIHGGYPCQMEDEGIWRSACQDGMD